MLTLKQSNFQGNLHAMSNTANCMLCYFETRCVLLDKQRHKQQHARYKRRHPPLHNRQVRIHEYMFYVY